MKNAMPCVGLVVLAGCLTFIVAPDDGPTLESKLDAVLNPLPTVVLDPVVTARFLVKNFKYALLIIFVAAAVITPSGDMMTQTIFAAPMVGLYILSIIIAWVVGPKSLRAAPDEAI